MKTLIICLVLLIRFVQTMEHCSMKQRTVCNQYYCNRSLYINYMYITLFVMEHH